MQYYTPITCNTIHMPHHSFLITLLLPRFCVFHIIHVTRPLYSCALSNHHHVARFSCGMFISWCSKISSCAWSGVPDCLCCTQVDVKSARVRLLSKISDVVDALVSNAMIISYFTIIRDDSLKVSTGRYACVQQMDNCHFARSQLLGWRSTEKLWLLILSGELCNLLLNGDEGCILLLKGDHPFVQRLPSPILDHLYIGLLNEHSARCALFLMLCI